MFKIFKWLYNLGVSQERTRIARELESELARRTASVFAYGRASGDNQLSKEKQQKLMYRRAVTEEVQDIVNHIMQPSFEPGTALSVMFPEESRLK